MVWWIPLIVAAAKQTADTIQGGLNANAASDAEKREAMRKQGLQRIGAANQAMSQQGPSLYLEQLQRAQGMGDQQASGQRRPMDLQMLAQLLQQQQGQRLGAGAMQQQQPPSGLGGY